MLEELQKALGEPQIEQNRRISFVNDIGVLRKAKLENSLNLEANRELRSRKR